MEKWVSQLPLRRSFAAAVVGTVLSGFFCLLAAVFCSQQVLPLEMAAVYGRAALFCGALFAVLIAANHQKASRAPAAFLTAGLLLFMTVGVSFFFGTSIYRALPWNVTAILAGAIIGIFLTRKRKKTRKKR